MSFLFDPPLLAGSGAAIERLVDDERSARRLEALTVAAFVGVSTAIYANASWTRGIWSPFGSRSGREFMLTSGLARIDERRIDRRRHAAALALFALYPLWLAAGRALARGRT